jgi:putative oxidoreductase
MSKLSLAGAVNAWQQIVSRLEGAGQYIPLLVMRVVMGWEFFEAGREKLHGSNWFGGIQEQFPFPFDVVPAALSWQLATWFELVGAVCLWLGLATRFWAFNLLFLTFVATAAVHWPDMWSMWSDLLKGYAISDDGHGNFKLPLLFVVMLLPLVFMGPGKLSLDRLIAHWFMEDGEQRPHADLYAWALAAALLGLPFVMLMPVFGAGLLVLAAVLAGFGRFARA